MSETRPRISIKLDDTHFLTVKVGLAPFDKEIYVTIDDEQGYPQQDLVVVRPQYQYGESDEVEWSDDMVDVLVWGDSFNEDYTSSYKIKVYHEIDEE